MMRLRRQDLVAWLGEDPSQEVLAAFFRDVSRRQVEREGEGTSSYWCMTKAMGFFDRPPSDWFEMDDGTIWFVWGSGNQLPTWPPRHLEPSVPTIRERRPNVRQRVAVLLASRWDLRTWLWCLVVMVCLRDAMRRALNRYALKDRVHMSYSIIGITGLPATRPPVTDCLSEWFGRIL